MKPSGSPQSWRRRNGYEMPAMQEFSILKHIFAANRQLDPKVVIGPGDDMALVEMSEVGGRRLLAAVDQLIDGRHVTLVTTPMALVGRKAITRSLSDIAAMAGTPLATLVAATLPPDFGEARAIALFDAMRETAAHYECPIIGGDLAFHADRSHPMTCSVTILAEVRGSFAITRSGAKPGDRVYVTGALGGSLEPDGLGRHLTFEPRISEALQLHELLGDRLHAMIDLSDGLGRDGSHIARMSKVQIRLNAAAIPCHDGCTWQNALADGEDYELFFAAAGTVPRAVMDIAIHEIGEVVALEQVDAPAVIVFDGGQWHDAAGMGWQHHV